MRCSLTNTENISLCEPELSLMTSVDKATRFLHVSILLFLNLASPLNNFIIASRGWRTNFWFFLYFLMVLNLVRLAMILCLGKWKCLHYNFYACLSVKDKYWLMFCIRMDVLQHLQKIVWSSQHSDLSL